MLVDQKVVPYLGILLNNRLIHEGIWQPLQSSHWLENGGKTWTVLRTCFWADRTRNESFDGISLDDEEYF